MARRWRRRLGLCKALATLGRVRHGLRHGQAGAWGPRVLADLVRPTGGPCGAVRDLHRSRLLGGHGLVRRGAALRGGRALREAAGGGLCGHRGSGGTMGGPSWHEWHCEILGTRPGGTSGPVFGRSRVSLAPSLKHFGTKSIKKSVLFETIWKFVFLVFFFNVS